MKKIVLWICVAVLLLGAAGTGIFLFLGHEEDETGYQLFYLNADEDELVPWDGLAEESDPSALVAELYLLQQTLPEKQKGEEVKLLLPKDVILMNFSIDGEALLLNFSSGYADMTREREILVRAGMVRLFSQIPGVKKIQFMIEDEPLKDSDGTELGFMSARRFVENSGKEINSYIKTSMTLYFADKEGKMLVPEERNVYYNSNVPLEKVVVEQLVKGPKESEHMTTLPPEMNILSVTIQDDICYVNLDDSFKNLLELTGNTLKTELAVYSIVNSLASVCQVNKIQISINGKTNEQVGTTEIDGLLSPRSDLIREEE
ncbi:MAG: GerMN domain-containing protein [Lachnospiraceae bacterium]|nr:GerMN domain-containing protein [Lachnospiraceae bacterium]